MGSATDSAVWRQRPVRRQWLLSATRGRHVRPPPSSGANGTAQWITPVRAEARARPVAWAAGPDPSLGGNRPLAGCNQARRGAGGNGGSGRRARRSPGGRRRRGGVRGRQGRHGRRRHCRRRRHPLAARRYRYVCRHWQWQRRPSRPSRRRGAAGDGPPGGCERLLASRRTANGTGAVAAATAAAPAPASDTGSLCRVYCGHAHTPSHEAGDAAAAGDWGGRRRRWRWGGEGRPPRVARLRANATAGAGRRWAVGRVGASTPSAPAPSVGSDSRGRVTGGCRRRRRWRRQSRSRSHPRRTRARARVGGGCRQRQPWRLGPPSRPPGASTTPTVPPFEGRPMGAPTAHRGSATGPRGLPTPWTGRPTLSRVPPTCARRSRPPSAGWSSSASSTAPSPTSCRYTATGALAGGAGPTAVGDGGYPLTSYTSVLVPVWTAQHGLLLRGVDSAGADLWPELFSGSCRWRCVTAPSRPSCPSGHSARVVVGGATRGMQSYWRGVRHHPRGSWKR